MTYAWIVADANQGITFDLFCQVTSFVDLHPATGLIGPSGSLPLSRGLSLFLFYN